MVFEDRQGQNVHKRRIKILNSTDTSLNNVTMDIELQHFDEGVSNEGTPINAQLFNDWEKRIQQMQMNVNALNNDIGRLFLNPDCSEANNVGEAKVTFSEGKLKFSNLKGQPGERYAITEMPNNYIFYVNDNGELCVKYAGEEEPKFSIRDDELVLVFD